MDSSQNFKLNEAYLKTITQCESLDLIEELNLEGHQLCDSDLKPDVINQLTSLVELDLSKNQLTCIPNGIQLKSLKYLNVSNNCLKDVEWLQYFPHILDIDTYGNVSLTVDDEYKTMFLLPSLEFLNGKGVDHKQIGSEFTKEIWVRVVKLWKSNFAMKYDKNNNRDGVEAEFISLCKTRVHYGPNSLRGYRHWRIEAIAKEVMTFVSDFPQETITSCLYDDLIMGQLCKDIKETEIMASPASKKMKLSTTTSGPSESILRKQQNTYLPVKFLQCHGSSDEGSDDFQTQIWCCSFEPDPNDSTKTTNMVATCGGEKVCFIDCSTLQVASRFAQNREQFYTLCWTTAVSGDNVRSNILAAAGCLGYIHLFHPQQNVLYGRIKIHNCPVQALLFIKNSTRLLSGDKNGIIHLTDVGVPSLSNYQYKWNKLMTFTGLHHSVIKLALPLSSQGQYLLAASETGLYCWKNNAALSSVTVQGKVPQLPALCHIDFPHIPSDAIADALSMYDDDVLVTKFADTGVIFVWRFSTVLKKIKQLKIQIDLPFVFCNPDREMKWSNTTHCYIDVATCKAMGKTIAGDDVGNIWIYDINWNMKGKPKDYEKAQFNSCVQPSSIIPFPKCTRENGSQMKKLVGTGMLFNSVSCSWNMKYIVVATDNNVVGVYKSNCYI